jgi:sphingomyelin phosphodiesterase 2
VASSILPYALNGEPIDVAAGDWFVGKAAASVVILHPELGQVEIFNTHLFAKGGGGAHRLVNAWEFSKLARRSAELGRYVIAAGDFNCLPTTLPMTFIRDHTGLLDSWVVAHPASANNEGSALTPAEAIYRFGVTADSPLNTWSAGKWLDDDAKKFWGKRLDYILYRQPRRERPDPCQKYPVLHCKDSRVVFTNKVPGQQYSYSDHFGLESTFEIQQLPGDKLQFVQPELSSASISTAIQELTACYRLARDRAKKELTIFGACVVGCIALCIGSGFLPFAWINPLFILAVVGFAWYATTMLYEGLLFGNWECNVLMNVTEELEIHRAAYDLLSGRPPPVSS